MHKWKHSVEKPVSYFLYRHPVCAYDFFKYGSGFLKFTSHQLMLFAIDTRFTRDQTLNELWWSINIFDHTISITFGGVWTGWNPQMKDTVFRQIIFFWNQLTSLVWSFNLTRHKPYYSSFLLMNLPSNETWFTNECLNMCNYHM